MIPKVVCSGLCITMAITLLLNGIITPSLWMGRDSIYLVARWVTNWLSKSEIDSWHCASFIIGDIQCKITFCENAHITLTHIGLSYGKICCWRSKPLGTWIPKCYPAWLARSDRTIIVSIHSLYIPTGVSGSYVLVPTLPDSPKQLTMRHPPMSWTSRVVLVTFRLSSSSHRRSDFMFCTVLDHMSTQKLMQVVSHYGWPLVLTASCEIMTLDILRRGSRIWQKSVRSSHHIWLLMEEMWLLSK